MGNPPASGAGQPLATFHRAIQLEIVDFLLSLDHATRDREDIQLCIPTRSLPRCQISPELRSGGLLLKLRLNSRRKFQQCRHDTFAEAHLVLLEKV